MSAVNKHGEGVKLDGGKDEWYLMPFEPLRQIIRVLMYGARKYAPDNWMKVPDARRRYFDAALRHLTAWWGGEKCDEESGLSHLGHAGCCILFLLWFDAQAKTLAEHDITPQIVRRCAFPKKL